MPRRLRIGYGVQAGPAPLILATDIVAGPTSGGENNKGAYLSIFGINFGTQEALGSSTKVYLGSGSTWNEVDNYRALVVARGNPYLNAKELIVQIGSLGGASNGDLLNIKVAVGSLESNTDHTFKVNPGDFYFASTSGSDATGVKNDITHPYRYVQFASGSTFSGIWGSGNLKAGDFIIMRAGTWTDQVGYNTRFCRFRQQTGSAPTGSSGTGYITVQRYPGPALEHAPEDVFIDLPNTTSRGGFHGSGTSDATAGGGKYFVISGLRIEGAPTSASTDAGPVNLQSSADNWRIVNCDISFPSTDTGGAHQRNGGIAGNGIGIKVLCCHIHDVYGDSSLENHGIYFDGSNETAKDCLIAYSHVEDVTHGSLLQFYATAGTTFTGHVVHTNVFDTSGKYGINLADNCESVDFYNNIVMGSSNYGLRLNTFATAPSSMSLRVLHNVFYNCRTATGSSNAVVVNENDVDGTVLIRHNLFIQIPGRASSSTAWANGSQTGITWDRNMYYDYNGTVTTKYSGDTNGTYDDPEFTNRPTDLTLSVTSAALGAASSSLPFTIATDARAKTRPSPGAIGPLERAA